MKRKLSKLAAILLCFGMLAGCNANAPAATPEPVESAAPEPAADPAEATPAEEAPAETAEQVSNVEVPQLTDEPVTLNFMGGAHLTSVVEIVLRDYLAGHPNVTVNFEKYSFAEYPTKMRVQLSAGEAVPDIMLVHDDFMRQFVNSGWLMDLTAMTPTDQLVPVLDAATKDGKIYGLPNQVANAYVFMYRKDIYDELGLQPPATYDEFFEQALVLKDKGYYAGAFFPAEPVNMLRQYMLMLGGRVFDENDVCVMEKGVEALQLIQKGYDAGIFHPSLLASSEAGTGDYWPAFNDGKIAVFSGETVQAAYYDTNVDPEGNGGYGNLALTQPPRFAPDAPDTVLLNTEFFTINSKTENAEAAKHLISYLALTEEACVKFSNVNEDGIMAKYTTGYIPGIQAVIESGSEGFPSFGGQDIIRSTCELLINNLPDINQKSTKDAEVNLIIREVVGEMFLNQAYTAEEAISAIIERAGNI